MTPWKSPLARGALALALLTLWSLLCLRPIWRTWQDHLTPARNDALFNLYVLKWTARQVQLGLPDLWDANFFYPAPAALTFSDHLLGPAAVLALMAGVLTDTLPDAVAGYNLLFFASFVLSGASAAWVLRRSGCSLPAAVLGGGVFAFAPFRLMHANHLQVLWAQWMPLTLWHGDRLLAERTPRRAALFLLFYLLNATGGCYLAYMIHVPLLALVASRLAGSGRRQLLAPAALRVLVPTAALALAASAAVFLPYAANASRLGLARQPEEIVRYGATLASYMAPSPRHPLGFALDRWIDEGPKRSYAKTAFHRAENVLTVGIVPTLFALYGCVLAWRRHRAPADSGRESLGPRRRFLLAALATVAGLAFLAGEVLTLRRGQTVEPPGGIEAGLWLPLGCVFLLALGALLALRHRWAPGWPLGFAAMDPWKRGLALAGAASFLLTFPVVYLPLTHALPGLDGMRVPTRFYAFASLAVALFAAFGLDAFARRAPSARARTFAWGAAGLLIVLSLWPLPLRWVRIPQEREFPEIYRFIATRPDVRALVEVPVRPSGGDLTAMYFSTAHWKPIANGYSGYLPPVYQEVRRRAGALPDREGLAYLRGLGITHLLVRVPDLVPRWRRGRGAERLVRAWESGLAGREVGLVRASGPYRLYRLEAGPSPGSSSLPKRAGWWKSGGEVKVGDQALNSASPSRGRSMR